MKRLIPFLMILFLVASSCSWYSPESGDPIERGLTFVASAIVVSAIIRALFNK